MKAQKKSATAEAVETRRRAVPGGQFPALGPLVSVFGPCLKRVRFADKASERAGFRLLFRSGHSVEFLENREYGLTSERQVALLKEHRIPCEILD
ncbi:MAG: hypothetical protein KGS61_07425 [Verrucomicrobia bacterium]|nr:hypothetical protein [Verrucomicrobiota bacterium]